MISKTLEDAINKQINEELYSEYIYLSMAAYFNDEGLDGFANFFVVQAQEERFHAMKFFNYLFERGGRVILEQINKPESDFGNPQNAFKEALKHEQFITKCINDLMDLAIKENDHSAKSFLQWYVDEQVEEEDSMNKILSKFDKIGDHGHGILMLDSQLASRTFTPPEGE